MTSTKGYEDRSYLAIIGDEDSVTGMLLAGIGHVTDDGEKRKNFLVVDNKTPTDTIERAFEEYTECKDIAILLINQHVRFDTLG
jgi:V-type H+-transporting ATPase subunit F